MIDKTKQIIVYGADWCPDCHRSRGLLTDLNISFVYIDIDKNQAAKKKMLDLTGGRNVIPTIILPDGKILQEPSNQELEAALGVNLKQTAQDKEYIYDVIMIGGGPASLTAAIYTTRERIETLILEKGVVGGMAALTDVIDNYPGFEEGVTGLDLADHLQKQAERFGSKIDYNEVTSITIETGNIKRLKTTNGDLLAKAVLIATGSDYKKVNIPGESEYFARGVHYCATCDGAFYRDKKIAVIGGGNSAVQEALFLTRFASHIDLLVRSSIKASDVLQEKIDELVSEGKITVHLQTKTLAIEGENNEVKRVLIEDGSSNKSKLEVDGVFVFVGLEPNSKFLVDSIIELDDIGFVKTNDNLETAMSGVFAAGDIRSGATMQIASAIGEGATAALKIRHYLEG